MANTVFNAIIFFSSSCSRLTIVVHIGVCIAIGATYSNILECGASRWCWEM